MVSRILAFRPSNAVGRLARRSGACPLSARELLRPAGLGFVLPVVQAPIAAIARGALVAAKELQAALGLALPPGFPVAPWFAEVTRAADEVAAGLPVVLCGEVVVEGEGATQLDRACQEAWALLDGGMTHLGFDLAAVAPAERGRVLGEVAQGASERGVSVEVVLPLGEGPRAATRFAAMTEEIALRDVELDAVSFRCTAPASDDEARVQAAALARICAALGGVPVVRRGGVTPRLLALLRGSPVRACDDGGAAAARAIALARAERIWPAGGPAAEQAGPLERLAVEPSGAGADRLEASAYLDTVDFVERLGASESAPRVARALERRLEES